MSKLPKHKRRLINLSAAINDALRLMDRENISCNVRHFVITISHALDDYLYPKFTMVLLLKVS